MNTIILHKKQHRGETRIFIESDYDINVIQKIKSLAGRRYSSTNKCWHIPYDKESWKSFTLLDIPYKLAEGEKENIVLQQKSNQQTNKLILIGNAAPSPMQSDIPDIESSKNDSQSMDPSDGDSKDIDIHLNKGGREVTYNGGKFLVKIFYNEQDVKFLKGLKGYWNDKHKKWILKATIYNLKSLQEKYQFWDDATFQKLEDIILTVTNPYLVTFYNTPDMAKYVAVSINGYRANTSIIQTVSSRSYQKENKRWMIPNEAAIIKRLEELYTVDGATVVNRLKQKSEDYHKKQDSYGDVQRRWLAKTEAALVPIIKAYTDSLMVQRYSLRTFDAYLNAFVNYAKHIGLDKVAEASNNDVRSYLATLSAQKISDSMLNTYVSALKFYYEKVLRQHKIDTKDIKRPRKGRHLPTILSIEEISRMIEVADNLKHRTIIYTLYSSGMRLNEILSLKIEDMWWDRDQIMVRGGKGKKDRVVPFSNVLKQLLLLYYEEYKPIYWLFEGQDRKHQYTASSMQKVIKSLKTKAKISKKVTAHTIRHCFATHLLEGGTDIRYIQELLGHKDIKTTLIYTHVTNDSIMKIESPLDKLMKNNKKDEKNEK